MSGIAGSISKTEAVNFLARQGHGVLSLARENDGYGFPISVAYDAEQSRYIVHLAMADDSRKQAFVEASQAVTITSYDFDEDDQWQSAVVTGSLRPLSDEAVAKRAAAVFFSQAADADASVRRSSTGPKTRWYALEIDDVSGRKRTSGDEDVVLDHRPKNGFEDEVFTPTDNV
ncbi:pyridoxamine 5'-phosphate oxidase family protein [Natribaculum luteum]|uniref:Pyridoxamine 5'-phosphate oxidase family protein n=1 Tax=Natribaculum luteum TaxID=1586232 RepID=A0ABD5P4I5_9EURY|nr:pyridoxamine 5'-phosphate oxidase family protein [Natribaculum luteum]